MFAMISVVNNAVTTLCLCAVLLHQAYKPTYIDGAASSFLLHIFTQLTLQPVCACVQCCFIKLLDTTHCLSKLLIESCWLTKPLSAMNHIP